MRRAHQRPQDAVGPVPQAPTTLASQQATLTGQKDAAFVLADLLLLRRSDQQQYSPS